MIQTGEQTRIAILLPSEFERERERKISRSILIWKSLECNSQEQQQQFYYGRLHMLLPFVVCATPSGFRHLRQITVAVFHRSNGLSHRNSRVASAIGRTLAKSASLSVLDAADCAGQKCLTIFSCLTNRPETV